jgi:hypothetical protein
MSIEIDYEGEGLTTCEVCYVPFKPDDTVGFDRQMRFAHERCGGGTANTSEGDR